MQFIYFVTLFVAAVAALPTAAPAEDLEKKSVCTVACDVTCNSTVLALAQTACLKKCLDAIKGSN